MVEKKGTDLFSGKNEKGDIMVPLDDVVQIADYYDSCGSWHGLLLA
jgi:hypothetical protein